MSFLHIVLLLGLAVAGFFLMGHIYGHVRERKFIAEYERAQQEDLSYARSHPGCTTEDTHQHRDRILKKYRMG